ncbi:hypothetical protein E0L36_14490 [Streptomyces sp. AJS327]|uniref:hypothetical protein n=1 Tax=Streptomyces sp. AJS327 TaxID=2545265 RepID=UPI0015DFBAE8|nr:hypothetical protein [Streptomyces sp. AJS327]MBA0052063.1 hypothetical protein [Streptomyces sp. AJS327]
MAEGALAAAHGRGTEGVLHLVGECLSQPPGTERPVVMLLGPHGSGASGAHNQLMVRFGRSEVPFAYVNFGSEQPLLPRHALALIARQLERKLPQFRVSRFPLLTLGLLTSDNEIRLGPADHRSRQRRHLRAQLGEFEDRSVERYGDYLSGFMLVGEQALGLPIGAPSGVQELVQGAAREGMRVVSGLFTNRGFTEGATWYAGHQLSRSSGPWDALIDLNQWRHSGSEDDALRLERVLFAAFLEDLRRAVNRSFAPRSFLLLLDNVHTPHGRRFLDLLVRSRQDATEESLTCDPLTCVASVNRWLTRWGPSSGEQWRWVPRETDGASLDDWRARRPSGGSADAWWYPLRLRDLTLNEVRVRLSVTPQLDPSLAPFVHRLTGGLPRAVRQVTTLMERADMPPHGTERDAWLRNLLDHPLVDEETEAREGDPDAELPTLAEAALGPLLERFTTDQRGTLTECAAALDLSIATQVLSEGIRSPAGTSLFSAARSAFLLLERGPGEQPPPTLHPWLRRLLLWELAKRPEDWDTAHELLADYFRSDGRPVQEMYHRLAGHQLGQVTEYLVRRYQSVDARRWIREFNAITAAPHRHPASRDHRALVSSLTPAAPRTANPVEADIRALLVARWVWSDPLADPGMRLTETVGERFARLSEHPRGDNLYLFNEAERYRSWLHPQTRTVEG